ncbi:hypothetical protein WJX73_002006 [Symbiochloris irregularis]|uniref:Rab3-GAP regulatory subunit N-terminal domain-containing protein n=1 Tax=Symbiochloris irregularis TaxID=706552 RepID=A0AAW1PIR4_9CHLO
MQDALIHAGGIGLSSFFDHDEGAPSLARLATTGRTGSLAVASGSRIGLLTGIELSSAPQPASEQPRLREYSTEADHITCLEWLQVGSGPLVLLAGTSAGRLHILTPAGKCLLCQRLSRQTILKCNILSGQDACVALAAAHTVFLLPVMEVAAAIQLYEQDNSAEQLQGRLAVHKWMFPQATGIRTDACFLGAMPASLHESLVGGSCCSDLQVLAAGSHPPLASFWAHQKPSAGVLSAMRQAVADKAAQTRSAARAAVYGRPNGYRAGIRRWAQQLSSEPSAEEEPTDADLLPGSTLQLHRCLQDHDREVASVTIAPGGRLAAAADSLGRVLLLSTADQLRLRRIALVSRHQESAQKLSSANSCL